MFHRHASHPSRPGLLSVTTCRRQRYALGGGALWFIGLALGLSSMAKATDNPQADGQDLGLCTQQALNPVTIRQALENLIPVHAKGRPGWLRRVAHLGPVKVSVRYTATTVLDIRAPRHGLKKTLRIKPGDLPTCQALSDVIVLVASHWVEALPATPAPRMTHRRPKHRANRPRRSLKPMMAETQEPVREPAQETGARTGTETGACHVHRRAIRTSPNPGSDASPKPGRDAPTVFKAHIPRVHRRTNRIAAASPTTPCQYLWRTWHWNDGVVFPTFSRGRAGGTCRHGLEISRTLGPPVLPRHGRARSPARRIVC